MSVKLYIRDNTTGIVREYGTDRHDSLILMGDGSIHYENLQNGCGTQFPEEGYSFCLKSGEDPRIAENWWEVEPYLDIGGDKPDCTTCKWNKKRHQKCSCCSGNRNLKCRYEPMGVIII
jgi:hypothetical protein